MWKFPIKLEYKVLTEGASFANINTEGEIPLGDHCRAFGVERKHDTRGGVDLYCNDGSIVHAVDGEAE